MRAGTRRTTARTVISGPEGVDVNDEHQHESPAPEVTENGEFDREYWENRYSSGHSASENNANPYLTAEVADLRPGTALDAGCGDGASAIWLAEQGWRTTAVDIAAAAVERGRAAAKRSGTEVENRIDWIAADLTEWDAGVERFDLVCAFYVHPAGSHDPLFERLATAVAPGGTLLIVTHAPGDHQSGAHAQSAHTQMTAEHIAASLDPAQWEIQLAEQRSRTATRADGFSTTMQDSVLRAEKS